MIARESGNESVSCLYAKGDSDRLREAPDAREGNGSFDNEIHTS